MALIVLSIHLLVSICLIGLVLLQRSEGGALGMGGGGAGSLVSGRGAADALAKMTSVAGGIFLVTSLSLTLLSGAASTSEGRSVLDLIPQQSAPATPAPAPATTAPEQTPDPTESRAPTDSRLASIGPSEAAAATTVPAPAAATTRAGPLDNRPAQTAATQPRQTTPASTNSQQRATNPTNTARTTPATTPTTQRSTNGTTTQPVNSQTPVRTNPPPTTAVTGIDLTTDPQIDSESSDNGVAVVRRERAGPDQ